ncbi:MAG TPA: pyridoxal phosphate-dependent aminotransferase [Anaerolineales bacterium]|nr:pyridoxal phosphate-dependent aminotransferase [Anaerolineales bacterium]
MRISKLAGAIAESPTLALNEEARLLREKGEPVINMGIGEPKNKTPLSAVLSASSKLTAGDVKYTPPDGIPSFKKAVVAYTQENYKREVSPANVIVSAGAKQSLFNILYSILDHQDEVIILAPYWVSYPEMIKMVHGVPVVVSPPEGTFHPRLEDIERAVSSKTRAIIVNSPNNPSGAMLSSEFLSQIVDFCENKGIYLIMDDIYHKLVFDDNKWEPAYNYTKRDVDSSMIIAVNGVSKTYGMTGFRVGWVVANRELVKIMSNVQGQITSCTSGVVQAGAEGALTGSQGIVESLRQTFENNRTVAVQELRSFNGVKLIPPQGAFYCLPDFRAYVPSTIAQNSVELSRFILKKALVVTVPGKEFGMEGHLRLSFAGGVKDVKEGIERIKWVLDPESPNEITIGDRRVVRDWL